MRMQQLTSEDIQRIACRHCYFEPEGTYYTQRYGSWAHVEAMIRECIDAALAAQPLPTEGQAVAFCVPDKDGKPRLSLTGMVMAAPCQMGSYTMPVYATPAHSPSEDLLDRYVNEVRSLCIAELEGDEVQTASARRAHDEMRAVYLASAATAPIACDEVMALAEAFERSANWLEQGVLEGSSRTHPLVGIADFRCASNALRAYAASAQPLPQAEPEPYKDAAPHLHVGDSFFESWYEQHRPRGAHNTKQLARDAYAAGMGDPLIAAAHPEGWVLVPKKVTNDMIDAANNVPSGIAGSPPHWQWVWDAMLAAAPQAREGEGE